jgi:AcrR family transcriptional regulator
MSAIQKNTLRGEALRQKVLDTALQLFSERGYFNTSIHDIRKVAGVSTGAIYHHFTNKEALAQSLYETILGQMDDVIAEACAGKSGCLEKSRTIIEKLFVMTEQYPQQMQFVLLAQHREYLPNESPICSSSPFRMMKQVVIEGIEKGEVRELEPWVAATAMFGGALRMMNLQLDGVLDKPFSAYLDEVVECAWLGIRKERT